MGGVLSGSCWVTLDCRGGATGEQIYYCDTCAKETEGRIHRCGTTTLPLRGWGWVNSDRVNLVSSLGGGLVAAGLAAWLL